MIQGLGMVVTFGYYYSLGGQELITPTNITSNAQRKFRFKIGALFTLLEFRGLCSFKWVFGGRDVDYET